MAARVLCGEGRYDVKCKERQPWKTARPDAGLAIKSTSNLCPAVRRTKYPCHRLWSRCVNGAVGLPWPSCAFIGHRVR